MWQQWQQNQYCFCECFKSCHEEWAACALCSILYILCEYTIHYYMCIVLHNLHMLYLVSFSEVASEVKIRPKIQRHLEMLHVTTENPLKFLVKDYLYMRDYPSA